MQRISSREFSEWIAFDRLEPFGEHRGDIHAAQVSLQVAMIMFGLAGGKGVQPQLQNFMPPDITSEDDE